MLNDNIVVVVDCKDKDGNPVPVEPYTKPEDCNNGIYYTCNDGKWLIIQHPSAWAHASRGN